MPLGPRDSHGLRWRSSNRIERLLEQEPCVGRLDRWSRYYAYNYDILSKTLYPDIIDFQFEEADKLGVKSGRYITEPGSWVRTDSRAFEMTSGDYDIVEGRLRLGLCGNNSDPPKSQVDRFRKYQKELDRRRPSHRKVPSE